MSDYDLYFQVLMMGLRLKEGIDINNKFSNFDVISITNIKLREFVGLMKHMLVI